MPSDVVTGSGADAVVDANQINNSDVKVPIEEDDFDWMLDTIWSAAKGVIASSEKLSQIVNMGYCMGRAIMNPGMLLNALDMLGNNVMAAAIDMAKRIVALGWGQISQALSQITGLVYNLLSSALRLLKALEGLLNSIRLESFKEYNDWLSDEECEYMFASMAACMLNKFFGAKLQKLEQKISNKIIDVGTSLNDTLCEELADVNSMSAHMDRQTFMMEKATRQIKGLDCI